MNLFESETTMESMKPILNSPESCYREIFQRRHILYGPCWLVFLSKILGYILIGSATISQIPQIIKILRRRNASGLSFVSMLLMLEASSSTVTYAVWKQFPISSWGENLVLMIENVILVCLLLCYNNRPLAALTFMTVYVVVMLVFIVPVVPSRFLLFLNIVSLPVTSVSRLIQIYTNHKNQGTGQLSAISSFLCIFQSFGRLTTSIVITRDWLMILTFLQVSILNIVLTLQVLYYRHRAKSSNKTS